MSARDLQRIARAERRYRNLRHKRRNLANDNARNQKGWR